MRTIFMGTPELVLPCLQELHQATEVQLVVTQPDARAGRGRQLTEPPVKRAAQELGLSVWQPASLRQAGAVDHLPACELIVVFAYGEILHQPVLDHPSGACINVHASLLPRWRGASPLQACLRAGDEQTGCSIMRMVRGLDAGPVYLQRPFPLPPRATLPWLHDRIAAEAPLALREFLTAWPHISAQPQDEARVSVCRKLTSADGVLDFRQSAIALDAQIRAYTPAPGCHASADGQRYRIGAAEPASGPALAPGQLQVIDGRLLLGCGDGGLAITALQAPGRKMLSAKDFLNGQEPPAAFALPAAG